MSKERKRYLGDGVYAEMVYGMIRLTTTDGITITNTIYLEYYIYGELLEFVREATSVDAKEAEDVS